MHFLRPRPRESRGPYQRQVDVMARILVVDDSWLIRQTLSNYLKKAGHEVTLCENGAQGIEHCLKQPPQCMLVDLLMPDQSGIDVITTLRGQGVSIPIVVLTADIQSTTRQRCIEAGASDFLAKPPNEEHLLYKINQLTTL